MPPNALLRPKEEDVNKKLRKNLEVSKMLPTFAPSIIKNKFMPEIFRFFGFSFFFYSKEHEPIHVHVEGNGGYAKFDLVDDVFVLKEQQGIKARDLKRIQDVVSENKDIIKNHWNLYFKTTGK